jgi:hypothetical protein
MQNTLKQQKCQALYATSRASQKYEPSGLDLQNSSSTVIDSTGSAHAIAWDFDITDDLKAISDIRAGYLHKHYLH